MSCDYDSSNVLETLHRPINTEAGFEPTSYRMLTPTRRHQKLRKPTELRRQRNCCRKEESEERKTLKKKSLQREFNAKVKIAEEKMGKQEVKPAAAANASESSSSGSDFEELPPAYDSPVGDGITTTSGEEEPKATG